MGADNVSDSAEGDVDTLDVGEFVVEGECSETVCDFETVKEADAEDDSEYVIVLERVEEEDTVSVAVRV